MRQVTAKDYRRGDPITTSELLRAILANEDGVFLHGAFVETRYLRPFVGPDWPHADTGDGRFRRANLRTGCHDFPGRDHAPDRSAAT